MSRETDLAWAAGFIDGEGSISLLRQSDPRRPHLKPGLRPMIQVSNTHYSSLLRLESILGGGIILQPRDDRPNSRPSYRWSLRNRRVKETLDAVFPYLETKRTQALYVLAYFAVRDGKPGNGRYKPYGDYEYNIADCVRFLNMKGKEAMAHGR